MVSSERVLCVVQARMGSTRLPGKVLTELGGRPMLEFLLRRLTTLDVDTVVVATSDLERDDPVASLSIGLGVAAVRGPEQDVLGRYLLALDEYPSDHVVRITADCPLTDPTIVARVLERHHEVGADYTTNVMPRTFPKGLDVEVARAEALRVAAAEATDPREREHVMPFLYRRPARFLLANVRSGELLGEERWTVDTPDDLQLVREAVALLGGTEFGWRDVLGVLGRRWSPGPGTLHLRPAVAEDEDLLFALRNDPDAVRFSGTGLAVDPADHHRWLNSRLDDPGTRLHIGVVDGTPVGMVRVDVDDAVGTVSIAVDAAQRGAGRGRGLIVALLAAMHGDVQVDRLVALVQSGNDASRAAFTSAGFHPEGTVEGFDRFVWEDGWPTVASHPSPGAAPR